MCLVLADQGISLSSRKTLHRSDFVDPLPTIPYHPSFLPLAPSNPVYHLTYPRYCTNNGQVHLTKTLHYDLLRAHGNIGFDIFSRSRGSLVKCSLEESKFALSVLTPKILLRFYLARHHPRPGPIPRHPYIRKLPFSLYTRIHLASSQSAC